jgi:hypothetical protein
MNSEDSREDYLRNLEANNAYCSCPPIVPLKIRGERIQRLERECSFFNSNADLDNLDKTDRAFLEDYLAKRDELEEDVGIYHSDVIKLLSEGRLVGIPLDSGFARLNCASCGQQIEICEEY